MHLPPQIHYLLFDLDGTLINTEPLGPQTFIQQLRLYGYQPTLQEIDTFTHIWLLETDINEADWLLKTAGKYGFAINRHAYIKEFYTLYEKSIAEAQPLPGAHRFLERIHNRDRYKTALVTASNHSQVQIILTRQNWSDYFDVIIDAQQITHHKPDPEPYTAALEKLNGEATAAAVFEDSKSGVISGHRAGCYVIGLRSGNQKPQDLRYADIVIDTFDAIDIE